MQSLLSDAAVALLSSLVYQPSAHRTTCILPYCGICWSDELPDMRQLITLSEDDRHAIFRFDNERGESRFEATFDLTKDQKRAEDDRDA